MCRSVYNVYACVCMRERKKRERDRERDRQTDKQRERGIEKRDSKCVHAEAYRSVCVVCVGVCVANVTLMTYYIRFHDADGGAESKGHCVQVSLDLLRLETLKFKNALSCAARPVRNQTSSHL